MARDRILEANGHRVLYDGIEFTGTFRQPLGRDSEAVIYWRGPLTAKSIRRLCAALEMQARFLDEEVEPRQRFEIIMDTPDCFVLVDNESDEPAPFYETAAKAQAALAERLAELEAA